ncbi:uncharacterized protein LOC130962201 [Arachis stenosperma]|uniref:uncharacterized protein LOC130962201 n=1 Tax=Arachis stenosperma TaxID=217475 RepID=UPI0025ACB57C|nr:uncharacterized protein LOC130962201 [Arachis stenosperma]XP_057744322.1 uncharacterized protein LOC130962201 [Arachis stenosperma]XP_057744323.1 uncharacterized protein LOC130962201 [Arachis stenosperma]
MMNSDESHPRYEENHHYDDYGFYLQEDFSQFLEEARQYGKEAKLKSCSSSLVHPEESRGKFKENKKNKKGKKSWKNSLVSWLKSENKNKSTKSNAYYSSEKHHGHVSGPITQNKNIDERKQWSSTSYYSGPLTSFFKGTKRKESDIPYMSLHQGNHANSHNYGPLYLVT